ncbi:hypothetical protein VNO77_07834 [Canavalia gladiata]|uniref:Legume lectin domain-containing protein n=1 Tax=Canavalia gladiata TaxID=3824 RepID=A0AAN9M9H4_CANGL
MAPLNTSHYFKTLTFTILFLKTLAFDPIPLFSFADFGKDLKFKSNVALYGNAKVVNGGSGIHFSGSDGSSGAGRVLYKNPIKIVQGKSRQIVSFSTYFAFSISSEGGLAFVMVPKGSEGDVFYQSSSGFPFGLDNRKFEVVGVEFSASKDGKIGVSTNYNVAMNVDNSVEKVSNTSSINLVIKSGEKLHAWIDYEAGSRRLEVRLNQHDDSRPSNPFLWHLIDLSNVLKEKEMFVGFSFVKGSDSQAYCFLYSWSFVVLRHFPHIMHSEPLDPKVFVKNTEIIPLVKPRSDCFLRVLAAMIFGTGCGALTAFIMLYLWTIFGNRRAVVPEETVMQHVVDVDEYRKVKIVVDKTIEDGKK